MPRVTKEKADKPKKAQKKAQKASKTIPVGQVNITASELLSMLEGHVSMHIELASSLELTTSLIDKINFRSQFGEVLNEKVGKLYSCLNEIRTMHCVDEVTLVAEQKSEYDDHWLELKMVAKTNPNRGPDLPEITGKEAKELLEFFGGEFPVSIALGDDDEVLYSSPVEICWMQGIHLTPIAQVPPTRKVKQLYVDVVHSIFAAFLHNKVDAICFGNDQPIPKVDLVETMKQIQSRKK
jgi:hypothetical protein|uniref:Uncharacterized protein n=1 Tax=Myoviridae sp. ctshb19 TaxID=2825194 RepID=A0A8S5UGA7_9CAUD|nr:MAG TPA: hypothetical protein [Myoviridae sp. ctshb19]